jgi:hypothetical protein
MKIEFTVQDIPPKKNGATSMWSKPSEAPRIISLRKAALNAMKREDFNECFHSSVKLELTLFAPHSRFNFTGGSYIGDLDTFITGVCDSLQAAHQNLKVAHQLFQNPQNREIDFMHSLMISNDSQVVSIAASKVIINDKLQPYYKITIETVE